MSSEKSFDVLEMTITDLRNRTQQIESLRAALAAERASHARQTAIWAEHDDEKTRALVLVSNALGEDNATLLDVHERVRAKVMALKATAATAIAERMAAEKERDAEREALTETKRAAERSLVVPCACGRPMPSVSSRLRCDACRAEAACAEMRETLPALLRYVEGRAEHEGPYDEGRCVRGAGCAVCDAERAMESDAGSALLAERDALRAAVEKLERAWETDPHTFEKRPCSTCRVISGLIGRSFGCVRKADAAKDGG